MKKYSEKKVSKFVFILLALLSSSIALSQQTIIDIISDHLGLGDWTISPFTSGYGLLEAPSIGIYGIAPDPDIPGVYQFPQLPVTGSVTIPVFLIDWDDFDPTTDLSNFNNPNSFFPDYTKDSPETISNYLNSPTGPSGYFSEISGGQLQVNFHVFPWMNSAELNYLQDRSTYYYIDEATGGEVNKRFDMARDVLRSAIAELDVNLTNYDADNNKVLDGFVIVYEGMPGRPLGTNMAFFGGRDLTSTEHYTTLDSTLDLVDESDPNYFKFAAQEILFNRYVNIPEKKKTNDLNSVSIWVHEMGHLLLGFRDYYISSGRPGNYALSSDVGHPTPYHAAALEKLLFGNWFSPVEVYSDGVYSVKNHHLVATETYSNNDTYIYKIPIDNDPYHYITVENRYFLPRLEGGSFFNEQKPGVSLESGLVIFEVNMRDIQADQIQRHLPDRIIGDPFASSKGGFQPGDRFTYITEQTRITVEPLTGVGEIMQFSVSFTTPDLDIPVVAITSPAENESINGSTTITATASDNVGVDRVEFYLNGSQLIGTATSAPFSIDWDTTSVSNGDYALDVIAYDSSGNQAADSRNITVNNVVNRAPSLGAIENIVTIKNTLVTFTLMATDPDGDILTYSAVDLPNNATLDAETGEFSWIAKRRARRNGGSRYTITFSVSDGEYQDSQSMTIKVKRR